MAILHKANDMTNNIAGAEKAATQYGEKRFSSLLSTIAKVPEIPKLHIEKKYI